MDFFMKNTWLSIKNYLNKTHPFVHVVQVLNVQIYRVKTVFPFQFLNIFWQA